MTIKVDYINETIEVEGVTFDTLKSFIKQNPEVKNFFIASKVKKVPYYHQWPYTYSGTTIDCDISHKDPEPYTSISISK